MNHKIASAAITLLSGLAFVACSRVVPTTPSESTPKHANTLPTLTATATQLLPASTSMPSPVPTVTVSLPTTVRVNSDGSGDYSSLEEAIDAVAPDSVIELGAGTFDSSDSIVIDKPLTIKGLGMQKTSILSDTDGQVLLYTGDGSFEISDVSIRHQGDMPAAVVVVAQGEFNFRNCRITGGRASSEDKGGSGLIVQNEVVGAVRDCEIIDNDGAGIGVLDSAQVTIENNLVAGNSLGILVLDVAVAMVSNNTISDNISPGISFYVEQGGGGKVVGNQFRKNDSKEIFDNGSDIWISGEFAPDLIGNSCSRESSSFGGSPLGGDLSGIVFISRTVLPANPVLTDNSCAVAKCTTPTGSYLSLSCE